MSWSIDGAEWTIPCDIERTTELRPSDISGFMLDKSYFNDVLGTYLRYEIALAVPYGSEDDYHGLFDQLTNPVGFHTFTFPYNGGNITFVGRVESVSDVYLRLYNGTQHWSGIKFSVIACYPSKVLELSQVVAYGLPGKPNTENPGEGDTYTYTGGSWAQQNYTDADEVYY